MSKQKKETRGGFRDTPTAKRPLKYGEETEAIHFRVPKSKKHIIVDLVHTELAKYAVREETTKKH